MESSCNSWDRCLSRMLRPLPAASSILCVCQVDQIESHGADNKEGKQGGDGDAEEAV